MPGTSQQKPKFWEKSEDIKGHTMQTEEELGEKVSHRPRNKKVYGIKELSPEPATACHERK